jgi:pyruvate/2-oxoglutarate dehydrogenase complex dihydrolipoamide dehydrogenase (E3) component
LCSKQGGSVDDKQGLPFEILPLHWLQRDFTLPQLYYQFGVARSLLPWSRRNLTLTLYSFLIAILYRRTRWPNLIRATVILRVELLPNAMSITVRSKKLRIAIGAAPILPGRLSIAAKRAGLATATYTYRTLLRPHSDECKPESIWQLLEANNGTKKIVIAGGGATACELGQSLVRLGKGRLEVHLVAPAILPGEDITLGNAAARLLTEDGIKLYLGRRLDDILPDKKARLDDGTLLPPADALVLCLGRKPSLETLRLENANVAWNETLGVLVNPSLRSISAPHVFACGDCSSAACSNPQSRTATHAAWTGYHAAANTKVPLLLRLGSKSTHTTVPRVVFTDPELASVGLSLQNCIKKYGSSGFDRLFVPELNTDRADMESVERQTIGFVEIRATKISGRILGFTGCGPAASELANEMSLAIENGLTVRDVARSLHSYPSHGYLIHRVALALTFKSIWGQLEACGPVGGLLANFGRLLSKMSSSVRAVVGRRRRKLLREWEAEGAGESILVNELPEGNRYCEDSVLAKGNFGWCHF